MRAREVVVRFGVERYGLRCRDLAAALGRSADRLSRWAVRASRRRARGEPFGKRLDALDAAIAGAPIDG